MSPGSKVQYQGRIREIGGPGLTCSEHGWLRSGRLADRALIAGMERQFKCSTNEATVLNRNLVKIRKHIGHIRVIHGNKEQTGGMEEGSGEISVTMRWSVVRGLISGRIRTLG